MPRGAAIDGAAFDLLGIVRPGTLIAMVSLAARREPGNVRRPTVRYSQRRATITSTAPRARASTSACASSGWCVWRPLSISVKSARSGARVRDRGATAARCASRPRAAQALALARPSPAGPGVIGGQVHPKFQMFRGATVGRLSPQSTDSRHCEIAGFNEARERRGSGGRPSHTDRSASGHSGDFLVRIGHRGRRTEGVRGRWRG
jgi:hypothetical protein